jgi:hypothetical protein
MWIWEGMMLIVFVCCFSIVWRKIFENNENGIINYVLWSKTDGLLITGNGKYIKAFNYKHGYLKFEYNLFKNNSKHQQYALLLTYRLNKCNYFVQFVVLKKSFFGFESKIENNAYYFTNGYEVCYLNADDHFCTDLPTEYACMRLAEFCLWHFQF